jgi:hypothetical protein
MERRSSIVEIFYRAMYLVFLFYAAVVISAGILASFTMIVQIFTGKLHLESWISGACSITLLWLLGVVRDFWATNFDLYRMDDEFSGGSYLERHLDHPLWPKVADLFNVVTHESTGTMEREEARRSICAIARENADLYEAVYEMCDDRMRWTLVNFR